MDKRDHYKHNAMIMPVIHGIDVIVKECRPAQTEDMAV